jgi:hypothetical protein
MAEPIFALFGFDCAGRDAAHEPALAEPVFAELKITQRVSGSANFSLDVKCAHNTGGHHQRCKASHPPGVDKVGEGVLCPYSIDIPWYRDSEARDGR